MPQPSDGPFSFGIVVFFDQRATFLTPRARGVLDLYKTYAATAGIQAIRVEGHVDASEDASGDRNLDKARAEAVADYVRTTVSIAPLSSKVPLVRTRWAQPNRRTGSSGSSRPATCGFQNAMTGRCSAGAGCWRIASGRQPIPA